ncbi:GIY-YIG nuclease family protein [Aequorivita sp. H23M31]|uniref:GIY-YIG nuclease family protein n=1 Tax=Aequorivita ciconiae TaxID=2494375 RepID=A0A410G4U0_9FLAO|nr:GIY-YIG nuclease family protein [Aequorivita sp. H23M31]QAA82266.1 GIY-YIG nuclease family protein [Aequorivita sp. H23M31]
MSHCYILYSKLKDKFYIGFTQENLMDRIAKHNKGTYGRNTYTVLATDWELFFSLKCECTDQAIAVEKHIKRMKSKTYIRNLRKYPEMCGRILDLYRNKCDKST